MNTSRTRLSGFAIIEALVALVIVGFGMLALAGLQGALTRNVDVAQQRTEATRLAQEKMEELRSIVSTSTSVNIAATASAPASVSSAGRMWTSPDLGGDNDDGVGRSGETIDDYETNTTYTRAWYIDVSTRSTDTGSPYHRSNEAERLIGVLVTWVDRAGETQKVSLSSIISKTDPSDAGFLGFPLPQNTFIRRPLNRSLDIPIPAVNIGNDKSAVKFGDDKYLKFQNTTGDVLEICTPTTSLSDNPTADQLNAALTSNVCSEIKGYIVAGYITKASSMIDSNWSAIEGNLGINYELVTRNAPGTRPISCQFGNAISLSTGSVIANTKYYICVIPLTEPSPTLTVYGPYNWEGIIRISFPSSAATANKYYICRYQYTTNSSLDINQANIQPYVHVNKSIDQQNYLIATTANTSTTPSTCPSDMTVSGISTGALHQICRSDNTNTNSRCPVTSSVASYAVTYYGNGNTGGTAPTDNNNPYLSGSSVTTLPAGTLTKAGSTFTGWNTNAAGTGTARAVGATFNITNDTSLYAQWSAAGTTYALTYNGNGGSGAAPVDPSSPYPSGSAATVSGAGSLTRSGFAFNGWNTLENGGGVPYAAGSTISMDGDRTLYAQWSAATTYSVTYHGNGNTSGTAPTDANAYATNATAIVKTKGDLAKTGAIFAGWNTLIGGGGTPYAEGSSLPIGSSSKDLYAQWTSSIQLATPTLTWSGSTNPQVLSFAVANATGYLVSSCNTTDNNNLTACIPAGSAAQTASTINPTPANKQTYCYSVIATGPLPYTNSNRSSVKCIHRQGNTYTNP